MIQSRTSLTLIEVTACFLYLCTTWTIRGGIIPLLFNITFISILVVLSYIDFKTYRLPDILTFPLVGLGMIHALIVGTPNLISSMSGVVIAGGLFWIVHRLFPQGLGFGDVKFVAGLGAYLGAEQILVALLFGCLTSGLIVGLLIILRKGVKTKYIPFGPFLALGAWITLSWGPQIINCYGDWLLRAALK